MSDRPSMQSLRRRVVEQRLSGIARLSIEQAFPTAEQNRSAPLSPAQERMWFLDQIRPNGTEYLIPLAYRITGLLDRSALRRALSQLVARHEILRTRYVRISGEPRQVIDSVAPVPFREATGVADVIRAEGERPFDIAAEWPVRVTLVRVSDEEHVLLICVHHIAFDGWSAEVLWSELAELYTAHVAGRRPDLSRVRMQYADYAISQRSQPVDRNHLEYWRDTLAGLVAWDPPTDRPRPAEWDARAETVAFDIPADVAVPLLAMGETPFITLLAAYQAFLAQHWGIADTAIGTPSAGRIRPETERMIGCFVNTLLLRAQVVGRMSFLDVVARAREITLDAHTHQDLPFERLVGELRPERNLAVNPLFQTMLTVHDAPEGDRALGDLIARPLPVDWAAARVDLLLGFARRSGGGVSGTLAYPVALFDRVTMERFAAGFSWFLRQVVAAPDAPLRSLGTLPPGERERVLVTWNATAVARDPACLPDLIERQVATSPDAVAVVFEDAELTYAELDRRANQLAHHLRAAGIGTESRVAICLHRSLELVVALLAVVKAGAAYVPVDPDFPSGRIAYLLDDSGAELVLSATPHRDLIGDRHVVHIDVVDLNGQPSAAPARAIRGDNAAYVIYTSGSTGQPKGVINTHAGIVNRLMWMQQRYALTTADCVIQKTPYSFDVSVWEFFWPLSTGATLVLATPGGHRDDAYLRDLVIKHSVTVCHFVPSMLREFLAVPGVERCASLRDVLCSGEALGADVVHAFADRCGARLHNLYGPTEAAVDVTAWECRADIATSTAPIGSPIHNVAVYVLDSDMAPVPVGVPGELYIGGVGVARGYIGQPGLTAERFVPDPYGTQGTRLYRTGDQVRWLDDGIVEFLGRLDHQVKVAGHRIEPGEIETTLTGHPAVSAAVVVVHDERLLAYVVPAAGEALAAPDLRTWLAERLPGHLVPGRYVLLDRLPLSPHGKLDRAALPAPHPSPAPHPTAGADRVAVRTSGTAAEVAIAKVWSDVLGVTSVSVDDGFFDLGGDSIRALRAVGALRNDGWAVSVQDLFRHQSPAALAQIIHNRPTATGGEGLHVAPFALLDPEDRSALPHGLVDAYPLSLVQAGMIFEMLDDDEVHPYHNVTAYLVSDDADFSLDGLRKAAATIVTRHEVLRTGIDLTSFREPLQLVHPDAAVDVAFEDLRGLPVTEQDSRGAAAVDQERSRLFDLGRPPLFRLYVQPLTDTEWRLGWVECHPILDGWSHNALVTELLETYRAVRDGILATPVPPIAGRFADVVALEREAIADPAIRDFWAAGAAGRGPLRTPEAWADSTTNEHRPYDLRVPTGDLVAGLRSLARHAGAPLKSVLFAAHLTVLSMINEQEGCLTGLATNGRPETADGDKIRGMFLNVVPVAVPAREPTWVRFVQRVFAQETALWSRRRYPAPLMQREWGSGEPLIDTLFNYLDFHNLDRRLVDIAATADFTYTEFALVVTTSPDGLVLSLAPKRIARTYGEYLVQLYRSVLSAMAHDPFGDPDACHLPDEDRRRMLTDWGNPVDNAPARCVAEVFAECVKSTPDAIALRFGEEIVSYSELDRRANRLAHRLREMGVGPDRVVGVCLERSTELVVAILAIIKSGGAYLALDSEDPARRIEYMLTDARATAVIATAELSGAATTIRLSEQRIDGYPDTDPPTAVHPDNLAYLIYTSGSTGNPKAVAVSQRGVVQLIEGQTYAQMGQGTVHLLQSAVTFDFATYEIWGALLTGAQLAIAPPGHMAPEDMRAALTRYEVTSLLMTFSPFGITVEHDVTIFDGLRDLLFGGEPAEPSAVARARAALPQTNLANMYGPTEATTFAVGYAVPPGAPVAEAVPIGRPIRHTEAYVLDRHMRPVPVGVPGELYLGGPSLARGYLNRPELTAAQFVPHPFATSPGARLYRTGDRVYWYPDGKIQFLGRFDEQLKISGYRIEPGEVEAAIAEHPAVQQVVVVGRTLGGDDKWLVAYVRTSDGGVVTDLQGFLRERVPAHMVPSAVVTLAAFPLTSSGKVNRRALPAPDGIRSIQDRAYVPPRTALEDLMAVEWARALGVDRVGVDDDFVQLGGHSLTAMRLATRLNVAHGLPVRSHDILGLRTVAAVAAAASGHARDVSAKTLVWFRRTDGRTPLFLIHPGGGSVHWYRDLAALLPVDRSVVAFQHPSLVDAHEARLSIEQLADAYLSELRAAQPAGPYVIFGWCGGTPATWELAHRLQRMGEQSCLLLLDPAIPGSAVPDHLANLRRGERLFAELASSPAEKASILRRELVAVLRDVVDDDGGDQITEESLDESWQVRLRIWLGQAEAVHAYRLRPLSTQLAILLSEELTGAGHEAMAGYTYREYTREWNRLSGGTADVVQIAGSHLGVLRPPGVTGLAAWIEQWLQQKADLR